MEKKFKILKLLFISSCIIFLNQRIVSCQKISSIDYLVNSIFFNGKVEYIDSSNFMTHPNHYGGKLYHLVLIKDVDNCKYIARIYHDSSFEVIIGTTYSFVIEVQTMEARKGMDSLLNFTRPPNPICVGFILKEDYTNIYTVKSIRQTSK